ncbi:MAG TPA: hypothetical protein VFQ61_01525, partial [Polyangiaceae bacterium]|nr:hypothetical protein [Polyangiaceae bacterium]
MAAADAGTHRYLGFATFSEYVERLFGYEPRTVAEKLRVARALVHLPELSAAFSSGVLNWSAVRELTRVATAKTENEWLSATVGLSARQVQERVRGRKLGDTPLAQPDPSRIRHTLRFDVCAEVLATFREALAKLRRDSGEALLSDDDVLLLLARRVLDEPRQEEGAPRQSDDQGVA